MSALNTHDIGQEAEDAALAHLLRQGYKLVTRNYRTRLGEIDIIAMDKGTMCFVEVRAKFSPDQGHPAETVTRRKQLKIAQVAAQYIEAMAPSCEAFRFDVVAVLNEALPRIEVYKNAFEISY